MLSKFSDWLNLFNGELSLKRYWRGPRFQEVGEEGEEGDYLTLHFTTRMSPALRWAAMRAILMFHNCEGQKCSPTTIFEEKGEPKRNRTEVLLLTSLTARPNRITNTVYKPQFLKKEGEPKRNRTEVLLLTSLTARPNRLTENSPPLLLSVL